MIRVVIEIPDLAMDTEHAILHGEQVELLIDDCLHFPGTVTGKLEESLASPDPDFPLYYVTPLEET